MECFDLKPNCKFDTNYFSFSLHNIILSKTFASYEDTAIHLKLSDEVKSPNLIYFYYCVIISYYFLLLVCSMYFFIQ